jgi:hypothetical protein
MFLPCTESSSFSQQFPVSYLGQQQQQQSVVHYDGNQTLLPSSGIVSTMPPSTSLTTAHLLEQENHRQQQQATEMLMPSFYGQSLMMGYGDMPANGHDMLLNGVVQQQNAVIPFGTATSAATLSPQEMMLPYFYGLTTPTNNIGGEYTPSLGNWMLPKLYYDHHHPLPQTAAAAAAITSDQWQSYFFNGFQQQQMPSDALYNTSSSSSALFPISSTFIVPSSSSAAPVADEKPISREAEGKSNSFGLPWFYPSFLSMEKAAATKPNNQQYPTSTALQTAATMTNSGDTSFQKNFLMSNEGLCLLSAQLDSYNNTQMAYEQQFASVHVQGNSQQQQQYSEISNSLMPPAVAAVNFDGPSNNDFNFLSAANTLFS